MKSKVQTGLRIPEDRYNELNDIAQKCGVSLNSLALLLIEIGLKAVNLGAQEALRVLLRKNGDKAE